MADQSKSRRLNHRIEFLMVAQRKFDDHKLGGLYYQNRAMACICDHCLGSQIISRIPQNGAILAGNVSCSNAPCLSANSDSSTN